MLDCIQQQFARHLKDELGRGHNPFYDPVVGINESRVNLFVYLADLLHFNGILVNPIHHGYTVDPHPADKWSIMDEDLMVPKEVAEMTRHDFKVEMELTSRILPLNEQSFAEVRTVLAVVNGHSPPFRVSSHCGLHVHVGSNMPYHLPWRKKFAFLAIAFEH